MSKFRWEKKKVQGRDVYQVMIGGHPHGNPCKSEEEANSLILFLEQEEQKEKRNRGKDRDEEPSP